MTVTSELVTPAPRSVLYYVIGAFSAPRLHVRELVAEPRLKSLGWQIVLFSALISTIAAYAGEFLGYQDSAAESLLFPGGHATSDLLVGAAMEFAISLAYFAAAVLLWRYLFGYRNQAREIWAASAMASCPAIFLSVLLQATYLATDIDDRFYVGIASLGYFLIGAMLAALYYSGALAISYRRAAVLSVASMALYFMMVVIAILAIFIIPYLLWSAPGTP